MADHTDPPPASETGIAGDGGVGEADLLASDEAIAACVDSLGDEVGVDTEFLRIRTFHPVAALYQLAGDAGVALIDAAAPASFAALKALLLDAERTKIIHSCSEDLEVLARHLDLRPNAVVDTQLAHAFLSPTPSASYAALVEHYLGVRLDKQETRSNWLRRPLSAAQLAYARLDVAYLKPIWQAQREGLAAAGRMDWFAEDMRRVLTTPPEPPERWYRNLKGVWRLKSGELAVLRSLVTWREHEARRRDLPRAWTVRDEALFTLARWPSLAAEDVAKVLPKRSARRYAAALVDAHRRGVEDPDPPPREPRPLGTRAGVVAKSLRDIVAREAERLHMAPSLLAGKRDVEAAIRHHREHGALPERLGGWRRAIIGDAFHETLAAEW